MVKVKATKEFEKVIDTEVQRPRKEGEIWEVSKERLHILNGHMPRLIVILEEVKQIASLEKKAEKKIVKRKRTDLSK